MATHNELGKWGEEQAVAFLQQKGYTIVERDWHSGHRDIDIIAFDEENRTVVFVEVKTRKNRLFGEPEEAIDYRKRKNLAQAINHYVKYKQLRQPIRFDVISIIGTIGAECEIDHIEDFPLF